LVSLGFETPSETSSLL